MSLSRRENNLLILVLSSVVVGSFLILFPKQFKKYKEARGRIAGARVEIEAEEQFAALREDYENLDRELQGELLSFSPDKEVDVYWLAKISSIAEKHKLQLSKKNPGEEVEAGKARELPIELTDWKGSTDSLMNFLHEIQSEGSSMDVRQIWLRTSRNDNVFLTGRMTVYCAYVREEPVSDMDDTGVTEGNDVKEENK